MSRKLLFLVFTNDACKRNHAFMYAADLTRHGHTVRIILDGEGTQCLREREGRFGELFEELRNLGVLAGACKTASAGCKEEGRDVTPLAVAAGLPLLGEMAGHAGIESFVRDGFEIVTF